MGSEGSQRKSRIEFKSGKKVRKRECDPWKKMMDGTGGPFRLDDRRDHAVTKTVDVAQKQQYTPRSDDSWIFCSYHQMTDIQPPR